MQKRRRTSSDSDTISVLTPASLARLIVADVLPHGEEEGSPSSLSLQRRADLLDTFSDALRLAQLSTEVKDEESEVKPMEQQQSLLVEIWSRAVEIDSWVVSPFPAQFSRIILGDSTLLPFRLKKPDEAGDFEKACEGSFFYALLGRCLRSGELWFLS